MEPKKIASTVLLGTKSKNNKSIFAQTGFSLIVAIGSISHLNALFNFHTKTLNNLRFVIWDIDQRLDNAS